ncbi:NADH dehydrogenase [ubiquinone] 1 alpha subcomplex subunit 5-like [Halichondria panicea]|uniref:NADH dehydrogenase [ubiquinone] 1 alpha subcomplex subunit 5-like n=1 Tax=Halichondria panicea TaxID=6063 RepID=UPI00312B42E5
MAANGIKKTTSLVGYAVVPNARDVLCSLYAKTLSLVQSFPRDSGYRRQSETVVQQRLAIVQADSSPESIEKKIGCGQMEELIDQAERELSLAVKMDGWKPWEPLVAAPPPNQWKWP